MAHYRSTSIRVAGTRFGTLKVAVIVVGAHAGVTSQGFVWKETGILINKLTYVETSW